MLTSLSIKNYTLIESLNIDFSNGFSVITGETGAGKSMLLGALGLILGKRADLSSLKNQEEKCVIEATFSVSDYNLQSFYQEYDLDYESQTIIRREILPSGKSRAFVNDSPVTLQQLDELGNLLMDIHSQHQTRELSEEKYQFEVIDILANNQDLLNQYQKSLSEYKKNKKALDQAESKLNEVEKEREFDLFMFEELNQANLKEGEQAELESEFEKLNNVEAIKEVLSKTIQLSDNEVGGITQGFSEIKNSFSRISNFSTIYSELLERISSVQIEFLDILSEVNRISETVNDDPALVQQISERLQLLYSLQKKHRVATVEELIDIKNSLEEKVISLDDLNTTILSLKKQIDDNQQELNKIAIKIHDKRKHAIVIFQDKISLLLSELGMSNARFDIQLNQVENYNSNGKDQIEFLFSANKGGNFGLLKKTASGGELSRIMLATKAILAEYQTMPTIIFDEIDTGVSGEIANKMAEIMKTMSQKRQVFSISHLPQIASKGNIHYKVYKSVKEEDTVSDLKLLSNEERIFEIAEMLSGKNPSQSALDHAKTLLTN